MFKRVSSFIFISLLIFTLFACSNKANNDNKEDYTPVAATVNRVDDIPLRDDIDLEEIEIENPDALCNTYKDVEPNFYIDVIVNSSFLSATDLEDDIVASECGGDEVELDFSYPYSLSGFVIRVAAASGFERGGAYTISIENNPNLLFLGKEQQVRKILFNVKASDSNELSTKTYPTYDMSKATHFEGYGDYDTYFYYSGEIKEAVGDIIILSDGSEAAYIEILKKETEGSLTKIYYKCPDADKIFNEVNLHIDDKPLDMEDDFVLNDLNKLADELLQSDYVLVHVYAVADSYGFSPAVNKFLESATVNVSFIPTGNSIDVGFEIMYTHTFESGWRLCLTLKFKWTKTFNASADAQIKTFLGIPVGLNMNCAISTDTRFSFEFYVTFKSEKFNAGYVEDTPKDLDLSRAKKAVEELKGKWAEAEALGYKRDKVTGDTLMLNIGYISFHFGYVSLDIDLYLCLKMDANITLGICYTYSSHDVLINYSSSSGNGDGGVSPSDASASCATASLAGNLAIELFLRIRVSVYITGLKFLASISVDVDAGCYLTVSGLGSISYNFINEHFDTNAAASIEFGFFFRVTLNINVLFIINANWKLYEAKAPLLKLGWAYNIKERANEDSAILELSRNITEIKDTDLLTFTVFDADGLSEMTKTFKYDDKVTYLESIFCSPKSFDLFRNIYTDNQNVKVENGKIIVDSNTVETRGNIIIQKNVTGEDFDVIKVPFHFLSGDAKYVTFNGKNKKPYLEGQKIEFPKDVEVKDGYIFKGWKYKDNVYNSLETVLMGKEDINFEAEYIKEVIYTVNFYDGFGNLIRSQMVLNGEAAIAPEDYLRDAKMEGYKFIAWDIDFSSVTSDLEVYAIYERVGDIV